MLKNNNKVTNLNNHPHIQHKISSKDPVSTNSLSGKASSLQESATPFLPRAGSSEQQGPPTVSLQGEGIKALSSQRG